MLGYILLAATLLRNVANDANESSGVELLTFHIH